MSVAYSKTRIIRTIGEGNTYYILRLHALTELILHRNTYVYIIGLTN